MKKMIAITLTLLMLTAMICIPAQATTGGTEAAASVATAMPGSTVEVVLSVYGFASVTNMGLSYDIPAGLELVDAQWLVDGDIQNVDKTLKRAVFAAAQAVDMTQKTPVFKLTFEVLTPEEGQTEMTCQVAFGDICVENNYQLQPQAPASASFDVKLVLGDMNDDGVLSDADALYLLRHTLFADRFPITQGGDVNSDGDVTDADALYLLRHTLFPQRFPLYPVQ